MDWLQTNAVALLAALFSIFTHIRHEKKINEQNQPLLWADAPITTYNKMSGPLGDFTKITQEVLIKNIGTCPLKITCTSCQLSVDTNLVPFNDAKILLLAPQEIATVFAEFSTDAKIDNERANVQYQLQIHCEELKTKRKHMFSFICPPRGVYDLKS